MPSTTTTRTTPPVRTIALPDAGKPQRGPQTARQKTSAAQRAAALKRKHDAQERRRRFLIIGVVVVLVAVLGGVFALIGGSGSSKTPGTTVAAGTLSYENVPFESGAPLAGLSSSVTGQTLDGVQCGSTEQLAYHIHSRLTIYVDGVLKPVPAGVGIIQPVSSGTGAQAAVGQATKCFYWLHTHAQDGVLHVESPTTKLYPLSDVFAIWGQPLSSTQVGPAKGTVTAYVNGKKVHRRPADDHPAVPRGHPARRRHQRGAGLDRLDQDPALARPRQPPPPSFRITGRFVLLCGRRQRHAPPSDPQGGRAEAGGDREVEGQVW